MLLSHLKLSICLVHKEINPLVPNFGHVVELIQAKPYTTTLTASAACRKKVSSLVTSISLCIVPRCRGDLHANIGATEVIHVVDSCLNEDSHLPDEQPLTEDTRGDNFSNLSKNEREMERRRKIGIANKGKVPWNKGRKHSEVTREIISQRTKEAMRDPKVRKKLSECPRSLSKETKARISMSHRRLWGQRLKWKRSREKIFQLWAESIARAAKMGDSDLQELEWDSYEKIKGEMHLEWAAQRAKEKETTQIRAERTAKKREAKKKKLAQKKRKQEEKAKVVGESKRKAGKTSEEDREELTGNQELNLRRNLMKIRKQKSRVSHISNQYQRTWENLDMKFERTEQNHTLADEIRLAKFRRAEFSLGKL